MAEIDGHDLIRMLRLGGFLQKIAILGLQIIRDYNSGKRLVWKSKPYILVIIIWSAGRSAWDFCVTSSTLYLTNTIRSDDRVRYHSTDSCLLIGGLILAHTRGRLYDGFGRRRGASVLCYIHASGGRSGSYGLIVPTRCSATGLLYVGSRRVTMVRYRT
jgi:hypothetical protein